MLCRIARLTVSRSGDESPVDNDLQTVGSAYAGSNRKLAATLWKRPVACVYVPKRAAVLRVDVVPLPPCESCCFRHLTRHRHLGNLVSEIDATEPQLLLD